MITAVEPALLSDLPLFQGLSAKQLYWLAERVRSKTYPANTNLITAEQPGEVVYFILKGTVKIHIQQASGGDVVLAILGRGDTVGEMSLIDSAGRSADATTLEQSTLLWMDRLNFQDALHTLPEFSFNLVRVLSARVRLANELIQALASLDVYGRVARQLLAFAERYGEASTPGPEAHQADQEAEVCIPIQLTQGDIADLVGASRKRVNQVMVTFKSLGLISIDADGRVVLKNRRELARYCR